MPNQTGLRYNVSSPEQGSDLDLVWFFLNVINEKKRLQVAGLFKTDSWIQIHSIYIQRKDPLLIRADQDILVVDGIVFVFSFGDWCFAKSLSLTQQSAWLLSHRDVASLLSLRLIHNNECNKNVFLID